MMKPYAGIRPADRAIVTAELEKNSLHEDGEKQK